MSDNNNAVSNGIGFGAAFALILSWEANHSFWWAILHGLLGWLYVAYYFLFRK